MGSDRDGHRGRRGVLSVAVARAGGRVHSGGAVGDRRNTCVLRAKEGTIERDNFSTEPAPMADVIESRRVAAGITRDAILIGVGAGALAAATSLLR